MAKIAKIFKIQMWVSGRNRLIFGRKVADRVRSSQNSGQNFFGFRQLYTTYPRYHLSWCRIWWVYLYFQIRIWSKDYKVDVCFTFFLFLILKNQWLFIECSFSFFALMTTFSNFFHKKDSICTRVLHTQ